jgi:hypothetical protein
MSKSVKLPALINDFINANNEHNSKEFLAAFAKDALVNDINRSFWGTDAIKDWSDKEIIGANVTMQIDEIKEHHGDYIVTALIDGDYDKTKAPDPLYLDYFFTVKDEKIVTLIIVSNTVKSSKVK